MWRRESVEIGRRGRRGRRDRGLTPSPLKTIIKFHSISKHKKKTSTDIVVVRSCTVTNDSACAGGGAVLGGVRARASWVSRPFGPSLWGLWRSCRCFSWPFVVLLLVFGASWPFVAGLCCVLSGYLRTDSPARCVGSDLNLRLRTLEIVLYMEFWVAEPNCTHAHSKQQETKRN